MMAKLAKEAAMGDPLHVQQGVTFLSLQVYLQGLVVCR